MARTQAMVASCLMAMLASAALAQQAGAGKPELVVDVSTLKEVVTRDARGQEQRKLEKVSSAQPGDTLVYTINYTNRGSSPAENARIVDPIPPGTRLIAGSWEVPGTRLTASVDGGKSFEPYPIRRPVKAEGGATVEREVDPSLYTHLRWTCTEPILPGETRQATFKVEVR